VKIEHHIYVFLAAVAVILAALFIDSYTGITNTAA